MSSARKTRAKALKNSRHAVLSNRQCLYALVQKTPEGPCLCYLMSSNRAELWKQVVEEEWLGTGHTKESLRKAGWRAKLVTVYIP